MEIFTFRQTLVFDIIWNGRKQKLQCFLNFPRLFTFGLSSKFCVRYIALHPRIASPLEINNGQLGGQQDDQHRGEGTAAQGDHPDKREGQNRRGKNRIRRFVNVLEVSFKSPMIFIVFRFC